MKFNIEKMQITIDQNDFENLKDEEFSFTFQDLTLIETVNIFQKYEEIDMSKFENGHDLSKEMFKKALIKWENIKDDSEIDIEFTDENKDKFYEINPNFCKELIEKVKDKKDSLKKKY